MAEGEQVRRLLELVALLALLSGCQWARVRYVDGAESSKDLACTVEANTFVCRDLIRSLRGEGVQLVPSSTRGHELHL